MMHELINRMRILMNESEGNPQENDLVDGIRDILQKQKEAHSEDVWYSDLVNLLKKYDIPLDKS